MDPAFSRGAFVLLGKKKGGGFGPRVLKRKGKRGVYFFQGFQKKKQF